MFKKKLLFFFAMLFVYLSAISQDSMKEIVYNKQAYINICDYLYYYEDTTEILQIDKIAEISKKEGFKFLDNNEIHIDFNRKIHWFCFKIKNATNIKQELLLELNNATIDEAQFFLFSDSLVRISQKYGDVFKYIDELYLGDVFVHKLNLEPNADYTCYFYLDGGSDVLNVPVNLFTLNKFIKTLNSRNIVLGLFLGIIFILLLTTFFTLYSNVKEAVYYNFLLYMVFVGMWVLTQDGFMYLHVWSGIAIMNNLMASILPLLAFYFFGMFAIRFLATKKHAPKLYLIIKGTAFLTLLSVASIVLGVFSVSVSVQIALLMSEIMTLELVVLGFVTMKYNFRLASFFLFAFLPYLVGLVFVMLNISYGLLNLDIRSVVHKFSLIAQMIILFAAINDKLKKQKEEIKYELIDREKKYRDLFDNAVEAIFVVCNRLICFYNPKFKSLIGKMEFVDSTFLFENIIHKEDKEKVMHWHTIVCEQRGDTNSVIFRLHEDSDSGKVSWMELSAVPIEWEGKSATLNFMNDITARINGEEERKKLELQLQHSQKMETIGNLAGGIAHDFNNILTPIVGYTDIILSNLPKDHAVFEDLKYISQSALRAKDLVNQILLFSRQMDVEREVIKVGKLIEYVRKSIKVSVPSNITIEVNNNAKNEFVFMNQTQAHQILINICRNAFQAIGEKEGRVVIATDIYNATEFHDHYLPFKLKPLVYIKFSIYDNGIGIENDTLKHIFDPFFTTKGVGEGVGLGLSVAQGIVNNNGGAIYVDSRPGIGTRFDVFLPLYENKKNTIPMQPDDLCMGTETILVIDDKKEITNMLERILHRLGYKAYVYNNSLDALRYFKANSETIDLVLTDLVMPHLNGKEIMNEVLNEKPNVKVLIMSGFAESIEVDAEMETRFGYIIKPIDVKYLSKKIRKLLDNK